MCLFLTIYSTMVEVERPRKLFVGGLDIRSNEKTLETVIGKFGPLREGMS